MTPLDALFQDILEHPDDDTPRLVYADWLDEHGDESACRRAEFIRLQIEAATLPEDDPRRRDLASRARQLKYASVSSSEELTSVRPFSWEEPIRQIESVKSVSYRRGFIEGVTLSTGPDFVQVADRLFSLAPVRAVELEAPWFRFSAWWKCPHLTRLRTLKLGRFANRKWDAAALAKVFAPKGLAGLTELDVNENYYLGPDWGGVLAHTKHLDRLTTLKLTGNGIEEEGVRALARAEHLGALTTLDLGGNDIGPEGAALLAESPLFAGLTSLGLGIDQEFDETNSIGVEGVLALTASPHLTRLRALDLTENGIGDEGVLALARWPHLAGVSRLTLEENGLTTAGLAALVAAPGLAGVKRLNLAFNPMITSDGIEALAASTWTAGLTHLYLYACGFSKVTAKAILDSPHLKKLEVLVFDEEEANLDEQTMKALEERFGSGLNSDDEMDD